MEFTDARNAAHSNCADFLRSLSSLEKVSISRYSLVPAVVEALGSLKQLRAVQRIDGNHVSNKNTSVLRMAIKNTAFPKLEVLHCDLKLPEAVQAMRDTPSHFAALQSLKLYICSMDGNSTVRDLTEEIGKSCLSIRNLRLSLSREVQSPPGVNSWIHPLLQCHHIEELQISYAYPISLRPAEVETLGKAWPNITKLILSSCPTRHHESQPGTSLEVLRLFALHCRKLDMLKLYFNPNDVPHFDGRLNPEVQFQSLKTLGVGESEVPGSDINAAAFFLAGICPTGCRIAAYTKEGAETEKRAEDWGKVAELARMLWVSKDAFRHALTASQNETVAMLS